MKWLTPGWPGRLHRVVRRMYERVPLDCEFRSLDWQCLDLAACGGNSSDEWPVGIRGAFEDSVPVPNQLLVRFEKGDVLAAEEEDAYFLPPYCGDLVWLVSDSIVLGNQEEVVGPCVFQHFQVR